MSSVLTTGRPATKLVSTALASVGARGLRPTIDSQRRSYAKKIRPRKHLPSGATSSSSPPPRPYVQPRSSPSAGRQAVESLVAPKGPPKLLFSPSDAPSFAQFESALRLLENKDLTAQACLDGAHSYVSVATQYESRWQGILESKHNLSPYFIHWLGILTLTLNTAEAWRLGTHLLRSASELGYAPSTVTLVRFFHLRRHLPGYDEIQQSILVRSAFASFERVLKARQDPNAFSLQGSIFMDEGASDHALIYFREAREVWAEGQDTDSERSLSATHVPQVEFLDDGQVVFPTPRPAKWDWEAVSVLGEADCLKARGQLQQAKTLYQVAALELDHPRGFLELANLTDDPRDGAVRQAYLLKAAVSGSVEACQELGIVEKTRAREKGITEREKEVRLLMSKEWMRLADGEDLKTVGQNDNLGEEDAA